MTFQGKYTSYLLPQVGLSRKVIYGLSRKADFDMEVWLQVLLVGGRGFWINTPERRGWKHKCTEKLNLPTDLHPQQSNTLVKKKKKSMRTVSMKSLADPTVGRGVGGLELGWSFRVVPVWNGEAGPFLPLQWPVTVYNRLSLKEAWLWARQFL